MKVFNLAVIRSTTITLCVIISGCWQSSNTVNNSDSATFSEPVVEVLTETEVQAEGTYPKTVQIGAKTVVIHPPQVTSWENFETIEGVAAIQTVPDSEDDARFGVISFTASAVPNLDDRTVTVANLRVTSLTEDDTELPVEARNLFTTAFSKTKVIPLDLALSHLVDEVIPTSTPDVVSDPPTIYLSKSSAVLLLTHGEPVLVPIEGLSLQFVANTNWPLFFEEKTDTWYLRNDDTWLQANSLYGPWGWAGVLPVSMSNLPEDGNWRSTRDAVSDWKDAPSFNAPTVFVSTEPAELILLVGEPNLVNIGNGLAYANNTDSQLFNYSGNWYYLVSGRWFISDSLEGGWQSIVDLPDAFAEIPSDHVMSNALSSVPGTPEAKMAMLDALIPTKTTLPMDAQLPEAVSYNGEPEFVAIEGTTLSRAVNTSFDVIKSGDDFYHCFNGTWFVADSPQGSWQVTSSIPSEIYSIPPSDPSYKVTYVKVYESTPSTVTYSYNSGYSNVYFYYGVAVWGTGWYYPPYNYYYGGYPYYYPYPYSYGSASYYNPVNGAYGSVSRVYGPYGGYGYASGINPSTGTYARAESVWDYDEWYGVGEAYNPSSGNYFGTERYYDADDGDWKVNSKLETQHGEVHVSREFDDNSGKATVRTEAGGEGTFTRRASDGGWDTAGQFTTADGRTVTSSGRFENGRGTADFIGSEGGTGSIDRVGNVENASRQGTFTRDGQTLTTTTTRDGLTSRTKLETSDGGRAVIGGTGLENRTGVGQTASGDVYATRDGNVYRRTDDGWQQRSEGEWSGVEGKRGELSGVESKSTNRNGASSLNSRLNQNNSRQRQSITNRNQNLNRQYQARQRGMTRSSQFSQHRGRSGGARGRR